MTVTAYSQVWNSSGFTGVPIALQPNVPTVIIRLILPNAGTFVIWGKVTITNTATALMNGTAFMTTLDGVTTLDSGVFIFAGGSAPVDVTVPLQSTLQLGQSTANDIVDIRCVNGLAQPMAATAASLIAIPVDALSGSVAPS